MAESVALWCVGLGLGLGLYAYLGYPLLLKLLGYVTRRPLHLEEPEEWPLITVQIPAYNEEASIARVLDAVLASDYPADKRQILVGSDASTDRTDEIVRRYADRGVELIRMPERSGKTATENAMRAVRRGEVVVHIDAAVRIDPGAIKLLVMACLAADVGVASSRDISTAGEHEVTDSGESSYVGYEMWVRRLETRVYGITGVSGSFFANRRGLYPPLVPIALSSDFASALYARRQGLRAVSVDQAIGYVPRNPSLRREFRRKVRTMTRGLETLWYNRDLLNPLRYGLFAWMLWSHKLIRWLALPGLALATAGWLLLAVVQRSALMAAPVLVVGLLALAGWYWPEGRRAPRFVTASAYLVTGIHAALEAWFRAVRGELNPIWEPTRRT